MGERVAVTPVRMKCSLMTFSADWVAEPLVLISMAVEPGTLRQW